MSMVHDRLTAAVADRYRIERELGAGGMAPNASDGGEGDHRPLRRLLAGERCFSKC
jgi:hypothetical protein